MTSNQPWSMCSAPLEISSNVLADEDGEVGGGGRGVGGGSKQAAVGEC